VGSARIADLRAELNRKLAGEDARVSMERARERRLNIEGRNLDADLGAAAPRSQGHIQTPVAGVGCVALAEHLRAVAWPPKFRPHLPEKYDGTTNPSKFLQVYITVITAAGGNDAVMASYFHVALTGLARTWLMNLSPESIQSWGELCALFSANFANAYQQHGVETHLHAVRQQPGESLRAFISRFTKMLEKLATHQVETVATLFALADKCVRAAEGRAWHSAPQDTPGGQNSRGKRPRQQDGDSGSCSPSSSSSRSGGSTVSTNPSSQHTSLM